MSYTAVRTHHGKQARITVYLDGVEVDRAGGARAQRAQAVIIAAWPRHDGTPKTPGIYGLRADAHAAEVEVHRLLTATTMRHRGTVLTVTPPALCVCVPVTEG